jgi:hypothetical protein
MLKNNQAMGEDAGGLRIAYCVLRVGRPARAKHLS